MTTSLESQAEYIVRTLRLIEEEQIGTLSTVRALSRLITRQSTTYTANINYYEALCEWLSRGKSRKDFTMEKLRDLITKREKEKEKNSDHKEKKKKNVKKKQLNPKYP